MARTLPPLRPGRTPPPAVTTQNDIEARFLVPPASRAGVAAALARGVTTLQRTALLTLHLDTADRRLARAGLSWQLRRDGRRWVQTLAAEGADGQAPLVHEAPRPEGTPDATAHAGTPAGERLARLLQRAQARGDAVGVRFSIQVRRTLRRMRTGGAVVELRFDDGWIAAAGQRQRLCELSLRRVSGPDAALWALAERWRQPLGLLLDPRSAAARGERLADGKPAAALRKAGAPGYGDDATADEAFAAVLDECLAQITGNAIGLIHGDGDGTRRAEHVHQLRVGIRRLRTALRSFEGWVPAPPAALVDGLRALFATLGECRDSDVLGAGVVADLARAGAPPLDAPPGPAGPDPAAALRAADTQRLLLAWLAWRATLGATGVDGEPPQQPAPLRRRAARRLRHWHARIVAAWQAFDALDEAGLHALRKRIKRQRYAVEFFRPLLRRRQVGRYLDALAAIQDRMGELNDLHVAQARYQALAVPEPAAWFALGWLAARIAALRALAGPELGRLAQVDPPGA